MILPIVFACAGPHWRIQISRERVNASDTSTQFGDDAAANDTDNSSVLTVAHYRSICCSYRSVRSASHAAPLDLHLALTRKSLARQCN